MKAAIMPAMHPVAGLPGADGLCGNRGGGLDGAAIAQIARGWIGTPYLHQGAKRGVGSDCLGLIRGIWREMFGAEPVSVPPYSMDWSEPTGEERLAIAAHHFLCPVTGPVMPGQVILFRMRRGAVAKHLGIQGRIGASPTFIHAYSGRGVVESPLSRPWAGRIIARFDFPQEA